MSGFPRNRCPDSPGITVRFQPDYTVTIRQGPSDWIRTTTLPDGRTKVTTSTTELGPLGKLIWGGTGVLFAIIGPAMFLQFWSIPVYALEIAAVVAWLKRQNWGRHGTSIRQPARDGDVVAPRPRTAKSPTRTSTQPVPPSQPAPSPPPPKPPVGWHPDPGEAGQRYWNRDTWREHTSPGSTTPTDGPVHQTQSDRASPEPPNESERHGLGKPGEAARFAHTSKQDSDERMTSMNSRTVGIEVVWQRIVAHQGEPFRQIRGREFTYTIVGQGAALSTTNQILPKSIFAQALKRMPVRSTTPLQDLRGPSYLYAILMDPRIRQQDWSADRSPTKAETALHDAVGHARHAEIPWAIIGAALGVSRQAAQKRFSRPAPGRLI